MHGIHIVYKLEGSLDELDPKLDLVVGGMFLTWRSWDQRVPGGAFPYCTAQRNNRNWYLSPFGRQTPYGGIEQWLEGSLRGGQECLGIYRHTMYHRLFSPVSRYTEYADRLDLLQRFCEDKPLWFDNKYIFYKAEKSPISPEMEWERVCSTVISQLVERRRITA